MNEGDALNKQTNKKTYDLWDAGHSRETYGFLKVSASSFPADCK